MLSRLLHSSPQQFASRCMSMAATSTANCHNRLLCPQHNDSGNMRLVRNISTKDVFLRDISADILSKLPSIPAPIPVKPPVVLSDMLASGESVLQELGLWSWWKPSSWLRYLLEFLHMNTDLPWCAVIPIGAVVVRLCSIYINVKIQGYNSIQSQYTDEINDFNARIQEARVEGDYLRVQQISMEQRDFQKEKGIGIMGIMPWLMANGAIFMSQFFAIKGLSNEKYPGFSEEGLLWFPDLSVTDPYYILPVVTAISLHFVFRTGIDTGSTTDTMAPIMRAMTRYGFPAAILITSTQFSSAIALLWISNNSLGILASLMFKLKRVRELLKLPPLTEKKKKGQSDLMEVYKTWKTPAAQSMAQLRQQDMEQFKKAGRSRPVINVDQLHEKTGQRRANN